LKVKSCGVHEVRMLAAPAYTARSTLAAISASYSSAAAITVSELTALAGARIRTGLKYAGSKESNAWV